MVSDSALVMIAGWDEHYVGCSGYNMENIGPWAKNDPNDDCENWEERLMPQDQLTRLSTRS